MIIRQALATGSQLLRDFRLPSAELDAEILLAFSLSKNRTQLYSSANLTLTPAQRKHFRDLLARRASREPLAYLTGVKEFYGLALMVDRHVLIPRPETETLVELALKRIKEGGYIKPAILDVGTGSGAIALAMAHQLPKARITAADVSKTALRLAQANAKKLKLEQKVNFKHSDLLSKIRGNFDIVMANLPYLTNDQMHELPADIKKYEPRRALSGGADGLFWYEQLLKQVPSIVKPGTTVLLEIGPNLKNGLSHLVAQVLPQSQVEFHADLAGRTRVAEIKTGML